MRGLAEETLDPDTRSLDPTPPDLGVGLWTPTDAQWEGARCMARSFATVGSQLSLVPEASRWPRQALGRRTAHRRWGPATASRVDPGWERPIRPLVAQIHSVGRPDTSTNVLDRGRDF